MKKAAEIVCIERLKSGEKCNPGTIDSTWGVCYTTLELGEMGGMTEIT
ncbi:MAG TPA: hypothetical protein G4O07_00765 [Dehalococcoidia bacterium]|nr:hypothetical protein [Dehalococcoidia bacterium]